MYYYYYYSSLYRLLMKDEKTTAAVRSFLLLWRWWLFGYIPSIKKRAPAPACCWMLTSFYLLSCGLIFTTSSWNISLNMMKMDSPPICKKKWAFVQKLFDRMWWTLNSIRLEGFFSFQILFLYIIHINFFSSFVGYIKCRNDIGMQKSILKVNINSITHI